MSTGVIYSKIVSRLQIALFFLFYWNPPPPAFSTHPLIWFYLMLQSPCLLGSPIYSGPKSTCQPTIYHPSFSIIAWHSIRKHNLAYISHKYVSYVYFLFLNTSNDFFEWTYQIAKITIWYLPSHRACVSTLCTFSLFIIPQHFYKYFSHLPTYTNPIIRKCPKLMVVTLVTLVVSIKGSHPYKGRQAI